ncbi:TraU family protein, partial [Achromobacter xylosoxidans]
VQAMSTPNPSAQAGGDGTTNEDHENNLAKFKNSDVIGHPGGEVFNQFASSSGYFCQGAGTAFMPYLLSTLDTLAWRYNVPEMAYPEALIPGMREVGARTTM